MASSRDASKSIKEHRYCACGHYVLDVTGRTAKRLLEMAGESDEFQLPITQEELAGMIGASRERVNKSISSFIKLDGYLKVARIHHSLTEKQLQIRST